MQKPHLLLVLLSLNSSLQVASLPSLQASRSVASPNAYITEAPSWELFEKNLAKRDFNPCTQWTIIGGSQVGCSGTNTCLFVSSAGSHWEYCGNIENYPVFVTRCYDYPTSWNGVSPLDIAYCPRTAPYCGEYQFLFSGTTFYNLGCSTKTYEFTVVTTAGAAFPGNSTTTSVPFPLPPSTTIVPATPTSPSVITVTKPTTIAPPTTSTAPTTSAALTSSATVTSSASPTSAALTSSATFVSTVAPTSSSQPVLVPASSSSESLASIFSSSPPSTTSSSSAPTSSQSCTDPEWEPTPENWLDADVDNQMTAWWANTAAQRGSYGFVDWIARNFKDFSDAQQCGIGESCNAPDCPAFQTSGAPRWVYFARSSLMEMNNLLNSMKDGMSDAEEDLSLIISDMAVNFFPWSNPNTNLDNALPWIEAVALSFLSFIPIVGIAVRGLSSAVTTIITDSSQDFTQAGFQELSISGSDPVTHQLGTIQELGVLIKNTTTSMRNELENWSSTLFSGGPDKSGKTIMDYMAGGRFAFAYDVRQSFMDDFFLQVWVSKLVNEQWQDKTNAPSKTFVMCTNVTAACMETSLFTEGTRSCCLYSIDNNANYVPPPGIYALGNSTYNITPADITASSLHSYIAQGLTYNDSQLSTTIVGSISLTSNATFLDQGIRFQGVWTLPVCDVGSNGDWVANTSAGLMPCCCGPNCSETIPFWNTTGILNLGGLHSQCKKQCSSCPTAGAAGRSMLVLGMEMDGGVGIYMLGAIWGLVVGLLIF